MKKTPLGEAVEEGGKSGIIATHGSLYLLGELGCQWILLACNISVNRAPHMRVQLCIVKFFSAQYEGGIKLYVYCERGLA